MNRDENFEGFDFVGKKLKDVEQFYHLNFRISMKDGEAFFGTCDYIPERYNFTVDNGIITSVSMG
jgi:hypothetical protein